MHSPPEVFSPQSRLTRTASVQLLGSASFLAVVCLLSLTGTSVSGLQRGKKILCAPWRSTKELYSFTVLSQ